MEQTKKPGDAVTSEPAAGIIYNDLITIRADKSTMDALIILREKLSTVHGELFDAGMMCCETGTYLSLLFSGEDGVANPFDFNKQAIPETVNLPFPVALDLMRLLCDIAIRGVAETIVFTKTVAVSPNLHGWLRKVLRREEKRAGVPKGTLT